MEHIETRRMTLYKNVINHDFWDSPLVTRKEMSPHYTSSLSNTFNRFLVCRSFQGWAFSFLFFRCNLKPLSKKLSHSHFLYNSCTFFSIFQSYILTRLPHSDTRGRMGVRRSQTVLYPQWSFVFGVVIKRVIVPSRTKIKVEGLNGKVNETDLRLHNKIRRHRGFKNVYREWRPTTNI